MSDLIDSSTNVIIGLLIAIVLVCSALIPIALGQIKNLETNYADTQDYSYNITQYTDIISIVLILAIIGLIIGVVKTYTGREQD